VMKDMNDLNPNAKKSVYIIAEAGVNHNGSLELAKSLIDIAKDAGANAVKFQTFQTEELVVHHTFQFELLKKLELSKRSFYELAEYASEKRIDFLSTPFDGLSLQFLVRDLKVRKIKIASGEITNAPFLLAISKLDLPVLLSTGMSTLGEIEMALGVLAFGYLHSQTSPSVESFKQAYFSEQGQKVLCEKVTLLHCTSAYPAPYDEINLNNIVTLQRAFGLSVGYSDHSLGIAIPIAAVVKGATVIEKHFTLDRKLPGPDHRASLEPNQLKEMIQSIRQVEKALGSFQKFPKKTEMDNRMVSRKSLVAKKEIVKGELYTEDNLTIKRPGLGVSPFYYWDYLGKKAEKDYLKDEELG